MFLRSLVAVLVLVPLSAQGPVSVPAPGPQFSVTFSKQPLEAFKAAFLTKLTGVALYKATACNQDFSTTGLLNGGFVLQAAETQSNIGSVDRGLIEATVNRARQKSKKYIAAEVSLWAVLLGSALVPGGGVATIGSTKIPWLAITGLASKKLSDNYNTSGTPAASLVWMSPELDMRLSPRTCAAGIFLGSWTPGKSPNTATATVMGVPIAAVK